MDHALARLQLEREAKQRLLKTLRQCATLSKRDSEAAHMDADDALLGYINDPEISRVYRRVKRWYA